MALPDPLKLYREALTRFETGVNALATRNSDSKELGQVINRLSKVSLGIQHLSETSLEQLYKRIDLPSRAEIAALAAAVQRVEDKLDQLLPAPTNAAIAQRPPRTRRPAAEAAPDARKAALKPVAKRSPKEGGNNVSAA
ncbi:hypothetical protein D9M71_50240 [compost metagenome]